MTNDLVQALKERLQGNLVLPTDSNYDEVRKVHNGMIDKRPAAFALCTNVTDVQACVNFARENNLLLAIRGGGHNAGGLGIADDALVIDLAPIKFARVDEQAQTVTVGGGCTWSDVDRATNAFGLAVPSGVISTTGVGGLTL